VRDVTHRIKITLLTLALMLACVVPSGAQDTKAALTTSIATNFPDNTVGAITPLKLRTVMLDVVNSYQQYTSVNAQTGTTYTVLSTDYGKLITYSNAAPVAVTLPAASTLSIFNVYMSNLGAGLVTITPTSGTINGAASASLVQNQSFWLISDGTNWQLFRGFGSGVVNSGTAGRLAYYPSTGAAVSDIGSNGSLGQILQSAGGSSAPTWSTATFPGTATGTGTILRANGTNWVASTATWPDTVAQGDLLYGSALNTVSGLTKDTNATRYLSNTGASNAPAWAQVALGTGVSGQLPIANGGTGQATATAGFDALAPTTTRGDLIYRGASNNVRLGIGSANNILATNGTDPSWFTLTSLVDTLTSCSTQGALAYRNATTWVCLTPGTSGQVLQSGGAGANPSWLTVTGTGTVTSVTCNGGLTGGTFTTTGTCAVDIATNSNIWSATASKPIDAAGAASGLGLTSLTDAATVAVDMSTGVNFTVTLGGNRTLGNPSNTQTGRCGIIYVVQDGTGSRTLAYSSNWKFAGGTAPTLTTTASAVDFLSYCVRSSTFIAASLNKDFK
jgi:hypothetical protein